MTVPTALFVLGMHRSGTSALTRVLSLLGADLPARVLPADWANETGYWEPEAAIRLHDSILAAAGTSVNEMRGIPDAWFQTDAARAFLEPMQRLIAAEYPDPRLLVLKDPRSALVFPLWREALSRMNIRCVAAIMSRDPLEVASSLVERQRRAHPDHEWSLDRAGLLWLRYNLDAERHTRGMPRCFCPFADLLTDWRAVVRRLASELDLSWPISLQEAEEGIGRFLQPARLNGRPGSAPAPAGGAWSAWIGAVAEQLRRASDAGLIDQSVFDRVGSELRGGGGPPERSGPARSFLRIASRPGGSTGRRLCLVGRRFGQLFPDGFAGAMQAADAAAVDLTIVDFVQAGDGRGEELEAAAGRHGYTVETVESSGPEIGPAFLEPSIRLYRHIRARNVDAVLFHDEGGLGYASAMARQTGQAFASAPIGILAAGTSGQAREARREFPSSLVPIAQEFIERRAVELADFVVCDDPSVRRWMAEKGWTVPTQSQPPAGQGGPARTGREWPDIFNRVMAASDKSVAVPAPKAGVRDTTVVIAHFEQPDLLEATLQSLRRQTERSFAVIVVDDGSRTAPALAYLQTVEERHRALNLSVIRQPNRYVGAARNAGIAAADTEFVIVLDDDNLAFPNLVESLRSAIHASGADIVTCGLGHFHSEAGGPDGDDGSGGHEQFFSAGPMLLGAVHNCFGDVSAIYRKAAFDRIGGFHQRHGVSYEDWHLHLRAVAAGLTLLSLPEALVWYRVRKESMLRTTSQYDNARVIAEVVEHLPAAALRPLSEYLIGTEMHQVHLNAEIRRLKEESESRLRELQLVRAESAGGADVDREASRHARHLEAVVLDRTRSAEEAARYARSLEAALAQLRLDFQAASEYAASLEAARARAENQALVLQSELDTARRRRGFFRR